MGKWLKMVFRPGWRLLKSFLLRLGVPLNRLLAFKLAVLNLLGRCVPSGRRRYSGGWFRRGGRRTVEQEISYAARVQVYQRLLNELGEEQL